MRGPDIQQQELFSYKTLEERVPADHPLRLVLVVVNGILTSMDAEFDRLYSAIGRPSIPPERLLRASLLQIFYTVRSERQRMEQLDFNLLFRWFVGLGMDAAVGDHSTFTHHRDRLLTESLTREFFSRVVVAAQGFGLMSDEHFSVDGTLIEAWASHQSFKPKAGGGADGGVGRDPEADFKGEKRGNATHDSTTDPEARLYQKAEGQAAKLCYMAHGLMETRNGLLVDAEVTLATGTAERKARRSGRTKPMTRRTSWATCRRRASSRTSPRTSPRTGAAPCPTPSRPSPATPSASGCASGLSKSLAGARPSGRCGRPNGAGGPTWPRQRCSASLPTTGCGCASC